MNTQWKLVPVNPTLDMIAAGLNVNIDDHWAETLHMADEYRAMIAATPDLPRVIGPADSDAEIRITWDENGNVTVLCRSVQLDFAGMENPHVAAGIAMAQLMLWQGMESKELAMRRDENGRFSTVMEDV